MMVRMQEDVLDCKWSVIEKRGNDMNDDGWVCAKLLNLQKA